MSGALVRAYSYDAAGNSLTTGATTHTYYNNGRMKTAKLGAASATTYTYNALGQRVKKNGPGGGFYYVYDEAGHLQGEYTSGGGTLEETVWLGDIPVATVRPNGSGGSIVYYVHTDQLNTPRKVTNSNTASLAVRWTWDPPPFGDDLPKESPTGLSALSYNLRFPGQMYDAESGLNYNYYRDLDPAIGRYIESDPLGLQGGPSNTFSYVSAGPIAHIDPLGLAAELILFDPKTEQGYFQSASNYNSPECVFTIAAHGYGYAGYLGIQGKNGTPVTPQQVWDAIKDRYKKGCYKKILVAACGAGNAGPIDGITGEPINPSFASELARISGQSVLSTSHLVGFPTDGSIFIGERRPGMPPHTAVPIPGETWHEY